MTNHLNGFSWFGLVVYFTVMGLVVKGYRIPIPRRIVRPIRRVLVALRVLDPLPPTSTPLVSHRNTPPPTPTVTSISESAEPSTSATARPTLRLRTESKIGSEPDTAGTPLPSSETEPSREPRWSVVVDLRTAPVFGVIVLLATTTIDGSVVRLGLKGQDTVRPYDVLVLFISLAYISTALDSTGVLRSLAFLVSQKAARAPKLSPPSAEKTASGPRLFSILFWFWFAAGALVGNDPIILSGTAFLAYFSRVTGIAPPTAFIFSQFIAANAASAVLVSSNPTNVLIAGAFKLNFLTGYTAFTVLPSVVVALIAYLMSIIAFTFLKPTPRDSDPAPHLYIPAQLVPPDVHPRSALLDPAGAIFHASLMAITLGLLVGTSFVPGDKVQVWMVTAAAGVLAVSRDVWTEWKSGRKSKSGKAARNGKDVYEMEEPSAGNSVKEVSARSNSRNSLASCLSRLERRFPTTSSTISRLPLNLLPFAGGIFILSRALSTLGWTSLFASWLSKICTTPSSTVFFIGYFTGLVLCPLFGTNIGATILLVEIISDPNFSQSAHVLADPKILKGAIFSTAIASNLGAFSFTFSSSLAGLLWRQILLQKGVKVGSWEFAGWNMMFLPVLSTVGSAVVLLECYYF